MDDTEDEIHCNDGHDESVLICWLSIIGKMVTEMVFNDAEERRM